VYRPSDFCARLLRRCLLSDTPLVLDGIVAVIAIVKGFNLGDKMKEIETMLSLQKALGLRGNIDLQLSFSRELSSILKQYETKMLIPNNFAVEKLSVDFGTSHFLKELTAASRAIAAFQESEQFHALQTNLSRISEVTLSAAMEYGKRLAPLHGAILEIEKQFTSQLASTRAVFDTLEFSDQKWFHGLQCVSDGIAQKIRTNLAIPEIAVLHWPSKVFTTRIPLLEDCVLNVAALERFHAAALMPNSAGSPDHLTVAGQFVFDHAEVIRRLPPGLPIPHEEGPGEIEKETGNRKEHRDEEIGNKLEIALGHIDQRLLALRQQAWRNLSHGGIASARLAMAGIREVFTDLLHALAPDAEIKATVAWQTRPKDITKPTRRMRLEYVLGAERACETDTMLQFNESVNRTQKYVHSFADDIELVRIQMAHLETWIYLLLLYGKK
jgi:hypothetical protein